MFYRIALTALVITYLICVLVLSGMQKEDLDAHTLEKLRQHHLNLESLNNDTVREECYKSKIVESITDEKEKIIFDQPTSADIIKVTDRSEKKTDTEKASTNVDNQNKSENVMDYDTILQHFKKMLNNSNIIKFDEEKKTTTNATSEALEQNAIKMTTSDKPPVKEHFKKIIEMYSFLQRQSRMLPQDVLVNSVQLNEKTNIPEKKDIKYKIVANKPNSNDIFLSKSITNSNIQGVDKVFIEQYFSNHDKVPIVTTTDRSDTINAIEQLNHFLESQDEVKLFKQIKSQVSDNRNMSKQSNIIMNYNALHDYIKQTKQKKGKANRENSEYSTGVTKPPPDNGEYGNTRMSKLYNIPNNVLQEITNNVRNTIMNNMRDKSPTQNTQKPPEDKFQEMLRTILRNIKKEKENDEKSDSDIRNYNLKPVYSNDNYISEIIPERNEKAPALKDIRKEMQSQYQESPMKKYNMYNFQNMLTGKPENRVETPIKYNAPLSSFPLIDKFKESLTDFKAPSQYGTYAETAIYKKYQYRMDNDFLDYIGQLPPMEREPSEFKSLLPVGNNQNFENYPFNMGNFIQNYVRQTYTVNATQGNRHENNAFQENYAMPPRPNVEYNGYPYNTPSLSNPPQGQLNTSTQDNENAKITEQRPNLVYNNYPYSLPNTFNKYPQQILNVNTTQIVRNFKSFPTPYEPQRQDQGTKELFKDESFSLNAEASKVETTISTTVSTTSDKPTKSPETQVLDKLTQLFDQINTLKAKIETPETHLKKIKIYPQNYVANSNALKSTSKVDENKNFRLDPYVDIETSMMNIPSPRFIHPMTLQTNCDSIPPLGIPISVNRSPFNNLIANQNIIVQSTMGPSFDNWANVMPQHRLHAEQNFNPKKTSGNPKMPENYDDYYNEYKTKYHNGNPQMAMNYGQIQQRLKLGHQVPPNNGYQRPSRDPDNYPSIKNRNRNSEADMESYQAQHYYQRPDPESYQEVRLYQKQSQGDAENYPVENYERPQDVPSKGKKYPQDESGKRPNMYRPNVVYQKPDEFSGSRERERKITSREKAAGAKVPQRNQIPLKKRPSTYDDTHFKNFLKTQQKVNAMLERILATKVPSSVIL